MASRERLQSFIQELLELAGNGSVSELEPGTSLLVSGLLDSNSVLELAVWIEEEVGHELDLEGIGFREEWDSIDAILAFIERNR